MTPPHELEPDQLRLDGNRIYIGPGDGAPWVIASALPFYYGDLFTIKRDSDKRKMLHFLLTDPASGVAGFKRTSHRSSPYLKSYLKKAHAEHDPAPCHYVEIHPFASLQKIQQHLLKHCFADLWIDPEKPRILFSQFSRGEIEETWREFVETRICPNWPDLGFDGLKTGESRRRWHRAMENGSGCNACINNPLHGVEVFIRCCRFFQRHRTRFLAAIKKWVVDTIQDNDNRLFYQGAEKKPRPGKEVARRHIHMRYGEKNDLVAYVCEPGEDGIIGVHRLIFEMFRRWDAHAAYRIKTAYGLDFRDDMTGAVKRIHEDREWLEKNRNPDREYSCHVVNWPAVEPRAGFDPHEGGGPGKHRTDRSAGMEP